MLALLAGVACERPAPQGAAGRRGEAAALAVCADPNNLPFSNDKLEGFENKLAQLVGRELGVPVRYTWMPQRRGFVRNTLRAHRCDVIMGVPASFELARPTEPYYRSTYVFVYRKDRHLQVHSFDDPLLRRLRIGVHVIGDDYASVPPAAALAHRNIIRNVVGYSIYGDYSKPNPPADLIDAVARGDVDVAIAWGPLAGYFVQRAAVPLEVVPVSPQVDLPFLPFVFDIAMAVRRGDDSLRTRLDAVLEHRQDEIQQLLREYGVPLVSVTPARSASFGTSRAQQQSTGPAPAPRQTQPQMGPTPGSGPDTVAEVKNPLAGNRAAMSEGRRLFQWYNCAGCHGDHGGGGMGPSLRDSTWRYGGSDARIYRSIAEGRTKGMPGWGSKLPPEQIWKIVAYIRSLRTGNEPDKPTP
jgi:quinoprotein dehydrogenase-associated probable ABC transporter substrate-binding protein